MALELVCPCGAFAIQHQDCIIVGDAARTRGEFLVGYIQDAILECDVGPCRFNSVRDQIGGQDKYARFELGLDYPGAAVLVFGVEMDGNLFCTGRFAFQDSDSCGEAHRGGDKD